MVALIHSFVTARARESRGGFELHACRCRYRLPLTFMMVAGMFVRTDLLPGAFDFLFLTLILIPISFALAILKGARVSLQPTAAESA